MRYNRPMPFRIKFKSRERPALDEAVADMMDGELWGRMDVQAFGGEFFHVECETKIATVRLLLVGGGVVPY